MALVKCPECNKDVSNKALKCPHCGKQLRKPKRGFFGKLFLWLFYGFNILMVIWIIGGTNAAVEHSATLATEADKAAAAIGTGIGVFSLVILWVLGDIITGLLALMTRPKS